MTTNLRLPSLHFPRQTSQTILAVSIVLGLLTGCSQFSSDPKPLPDSTFTRILTELHLAEARHQVDVPYPRGLRDSIFARYGVSPATFNATLEYYSQRPTAFDKLYQPIIDSLQAFQRVRPSAPNVPDSIDQVKGPYGPTP